ncbi:MAG: hypothetical protein B6I22_05685 [Desulfobacteraceae bacterium 4572_123]|nr:MAG: hypothetical protein B6I22_05685 [Desulfobacteraceae bacterium 4572_123]
MRYFTKRRVGPGRKRYDSESISEEDPMAAVANLFDVGLVFIVALIVTLFSAYHLQDLFDQNSEFTIMKKNKNGEMEIITKKGQKIEAMKVSKKKASGQGERLGVAYRLQDGSMVYVPE